MRRVCAGTPVHYEQTVSTSLFGCGPTKAPLRLAVTLLRHLLHFLHPPPGAYTRPLSARREHFLSHVVGCLAGFRTKTAQVEQTCGRV
jgi:hypothetical protein